MIFLFGGLAFFLSFFFLTLQSGELQLEQMSNTSLVPSFITSDIQIVLAGSSTWFVSKCEITYEVVMTQGTDVILPGCAFFFFFRVDGENRLKHEAAFVYN